MVELPNEHELARDLGVVLKLASADRPCTPRALSAGERALHERIPCAHRSRIWLRGRAAWKRLLRAFGEDQDTARFALPSARFSLTHGEGLTLAVGLAPECAFGVGIDLELARVPPDSARFFLHAGECRAVRACGRPHAALQRLWTVKEAVFKADPWNHDRRLLDYRLEAPMAAIGRARRGAEDLVLCYASRACAGGFLTVAAAPFRGTCHG